MSDIVADTEIMLIVRGSPKNKSNFEISSERYSVMFVHDSRKINFKKVRSKKSPRSRALLYLSLYDEENEKIHDVEFLFVSEKN